MELQVHWADAAIIVLYLLAMIGMGFYFARRQTDRKQYYIAGRRLPAWAIGLSILATLISSVTFVAYPGQGYASNWILLVQGLMVPVVLIFMIWFIVPLFREVIGLSTYEYFEKRFGIFARLYASIAFAMAHFSKMGTVFFLLALVLSTVTGVDVTTLIVVLGIAVVFYTLLGGIEAVVWSDVIQGTLLLLAAILSLGVIFFSLPVSPGELIKTAWDAGKIDVGPYDWDFTRLTFIVIALNGVFYGIQKYGTDQTIVQRYLTARTDKDAIRAALVGVLLCVPVWATFMLIGSMLYAYYQIAPVDFPADMRPDAVFPYFIMHQLPVGVTGLILAGLIAAAFSSLDSDLNSLAAVSVEDYILRFKEGVSERTALMLGRIMVVVFGVASIGIAMYYVNAENETVLSVIFTFYAIFSGGIAGLFLLGVLTRRANKQGLYVGIVVTVLFTAWAVLTSTPLVKGGNAVLDLGRFNYTHHSYMLGVYTHIIIFGVSYLSSLGFSSEPAPDSLTIHGWLNRRRAARAAAKAR